MQVPVVDMTGKQVKTIDLPADIFEVEVNVGLMHQAYVRQMAGLRLGTHSVQRRSEVSRTSAKMYRQKGTGRARHGSRDATQFVGGGRPMGPKPRDYTKGVNKKVRRGALISALSLRNKEQRLIVLKDLDLGEIKTKRMAEILEKLGVKKGLVVEGLQNDVAVKSIRNLRNAKVLAPEGLNVYDVLKYDTLVLTEQTAKQVEERLLS